MEKTVDVDPFNAEIQSSAVKECAKGSLSASDFTFEKDEDEEQREWDEGYHEDDESNPKDELDLLKKITIGDRRSTRQRAATKRKGYCLDSSLLPHNWKRTVTLRRSLQH